MNAEKEKLRASLIQVHGHDSVGFEVQTCSLALTEPVTEPSIVHKQIMNSMKKQGKDSSYSKNLVKQVRGDIGPCGLCMVCTKDKKGRSID